jgi:branched-chain amino acid aminotransferase
MPGVIAIHRTSKPRLSEQVRENAQFGAVFSDHMFVADYENGRWGEPQIVPYGPMPLPPSLSALHYGQAIFEGFKAYRTVDGGIAVFRPRDNHARLNRSAARLCMPEVPGSLFLEGVAELIRLDRDWIPHREGGALYVRPVYFATDEALGVRPAKSYRLVVLTCPVGPYFGEPIRLLAEEHYVRAFPGGTGDVKPAGNYAGSLLAAGLARERGFHNVLWLDALEHRFVEECGVMNIFFVIRGVATTPLLTGTILPGVIRDSVLTLLSESGVEVKEGPIAMDEVVATHAAGDLTEAFGVGTAATVAPIERIRYREREIQLLVERQGSIAEKVRSRLEAVQTGREADKHGWLVRL